MKRTLFAALALLFASAASVGAESAPDPAPPAPKPTLVRTVVHRPARHATIVRRFVPPGAPPPSYVFNVIAPAEAARFGANLSVLTCRIDRESHGVVSAVNGQYHGVGQFAYSTYTRGLETMPRGVRLRDHLRRLRRSRVVRVYSDGHVVRRPGRLVRVDVLRIRKGVIVPYYTHAWAQVRIMAQALVGRSHVHSSEWSTRSVCG